MEHGRAVFMVVPVWTPRIQSYLKLITRMYVGKKMEDKFVLQLLEQEEKKLQVQAAYPVVGREIKDEDDAGE